MIFMDGNSGTSCICVYVTVMVLICHDVLLYTVCMIQQKNHLLTCDITYMMTPSSFLLVYFSLSNPCSECPLIYYLPKSLFTPCIITNLYWVVKVGRNLLSAADIFITFIDHIDKKDSVTFVC